MAYGSQLHSTLLLPSCLLSREIGDTPMPRSGLMQKWRETSLVAWVINLTSLRVTRENNKILGDDYRCLIGNDKVVVFLGAFTK